MPYLLLFLYYSEDAAILLTAALSLSLSLSLLMLSSCLPTLSRRMGGREALTGCFMGLILRYLSLF